MSAMPIKSGQIDSTLRPCTPVCAAPSWLERTSTIGSTWPCTRATASGLAPRRAPMFATIWSTFRTTLPFDVWSLVVLPSRNATSFSCARRFA